ncbi:DUF4241 domain-containing protein [Polyangium jinanense]|uniref:DUF4241 domain-containing protein n=1 Tax=Polyangium jinanense TaxID=2829994 RepID=A0A9X3XG53_9BACT|nr:DUF4241 domain-containing protein [Polyangium jinanense]MDC3961056.1 DUF4241 domain-containing protein [Polyangium jinanense]MDC3987476.1 DUF4241 domain-containing protein [Polyangium jinanense]
MAAVPTPPGHSSASQERPKASVPAPSQLDFHDLFAGAPLRVRDEEADQLVAVPARRLGIGMLVVPTGKLMAGDPLANLSANHVLSRTVPPGRYPVELLLHDDERGRANELLLARVVFGAGRPTRWETAAVAGQNPAPSRPGVRTGYPSDAATGCFVDASVFAEYTPPPQVRQSIRGGIVHKEYINDGRAERNSGELMQALRATRDAPGGSLGHAEWKGTLGNLVAFGLGGDQVVPTYWGIDASGALVEIVSVIGLDEERFPDVRWPDG